MTFSTEDRWITGSMAVTMGGVITGALRGEPRVFGITALGVIGLLLIGWRVTRSLRLGWLLLVGLIAGVLELWADWLHVVYFQSLVYTDYFGFRMLASPSYMPLGWALTVVQFGYLGLRVSENRSFWFAVLLVTLVGLLLPPWYEELAFRAGAWYYRPGQLMVGHTPVWIIFTYGGSSFAIATLALIFIARVPGDGRRWLVCSPLQASCSRVCFGTRFWGAANSQDMKSGASDLA